jgi:hypothetical protein
VPLSHKPELIAVSGKVLQKCGSPTPPTLPAPNANLLEEMAPHLSLEGQAAVQRKYFLSDLSISFSMLARRDKFVREY